MMLLSGVTWIGNSMAGGWVYSRAEGLVVGDAGYVSPEYTVTVLEMLVRNGQQVEKGELVARVSSSRIAVLTAKLSADSSALVSLMAQINAKNNAIDMLVNSAEARQRIVEDNSIQLASIKEKGNLPILTQNAVADQVFKGKQELAILRAERETMSRQVAQIIAASRFNDQAIDDINALYDAGRIKAPMPGVISGVEAGPGSVVLPGQLIAEMVGNQRYVLCYFPVARLYDLRVDMPVTVEAGMIGRRLSGRIVNVMPIAARLPKEFQKTLSSVERQQAVRVDLDPDQEPLPYFTKVVVR
jgi:multidrug resistance efflux pump